MKNHNHGEHAAAATHHAVHNISSHMMKGAAMSTGAKSEGLIINKIAKHPLLILGAGIVAGYLAHKYRKEIINAASSVTDKSKNFVLQQKENLEDIVAESKEAKD